MRGRGGLRRCDGGGALASVLLAWLVVLGNVAAAPSAQAHAYVVDTSPEHGSEVDSPPDAVRVTFDEPVTLPGVDAARVLDAQGERVEAGPATLDDARTTLTVPLPDDLPRGTYLASWSVVSADTHPAGGSLQFGYGVPASTLTAADDPAGPSPALTLATGLVKGALYLALVLALGVPPAALLLAADDAERRRVVRLARAGVTAAIALSVAQLVVQQAWIASSAPSDAPTATWATTGAYLRSPYALLVELRIVALGAVLVSLRSLARAGRVGRPAFPAARAAAVHGALGVLVVGTVAANGHGGSGAWWRLTSTTLHGVAAVAWLGGLLVLAWLLLARRLTPERLTRMPWWSAYAGAAAAALVASGVLQGVVEVRYPEALWTTTYGAVLLVKLGLVIALLTLAVAGHRWTRAQRGRDRPEAGQTARLRGRVRWEAAAAAVVVMVSGVLSSVPPAETAYAPTASVERRVGPYQVTFQAAPTRPGPQTFRITVVQPTADTPLPRSVQLTLRDDAAGLTGVEAQFPYRVTGTNHPGEPTPVTFTSAAVTVPTAGEWTATLTVVAGELEQYTVAIDFPVLE